ncbi:hypothetical protein WMF26_31815 [Sorangium sp. So ce185]|uniref:hypothetical protein n=1 Tax=Sorangium sp. So ce185 TaxID=3133287 RepID=UPI003F6130E8
MSRYIADLAIDAVSGTAADTSASVLNEDRFVESVESLEMSKNGARISLDRHARNAETQLACAETMTSWPHVTPRQFVRDG